MLYQISYISEATGPMDEATLADILNTARNKNKESDITGMLLFKAGMFMQVLEGPKEAVMATYARIKHDPRHESVSGLLKGEIKQRAFGEWAMGFSTPETSEVRELKGFSDFMDSSWSFDQLSNNPQRVYRLLTGFRGQSL